MALWESLHSLLCLFLGKVLYYNFPDVTGMEIHFLVLLSDTVIHLQFVKNLCVKDFFWGTIGLWSE